MISETRAQVLAALLRPILAVELPPDAAGSKALVLAILAVRAESADEGVREPGLEDALSRDIHLLPAFIASEHDRGHSDDVVTLVGRFVRGDRAPADSTLSTPDACGSAARWARLRELQRWGVDLSLIEMTLRQSPTQRITNMERQLRLVRQLQQAARSLGSG